MSRNSLLKLLYSNTKSELIDKIATIILPETEKIADSFYKYMQVREESAHYLDNNTVQTRLRASMKEWLENLLIKRSTDEETEEFIERQQYIGSRHARISLSLSAMQIGTAAIKREIFCRIIQSGMNSGELTDAIVFIDELVDLSISAMNQAYVTDMVSDAKDQQTLKMQAIGFDMALQSESLRASLFDWHRQIIRILFEGGHDATGIPSIRRTNFGLWVMHKGDLLFSGAAEIQHLKEITNEIDITFHQAMQFCGNPASEDLKNTLTKIDKLIENASDTLGLMTDRSLTLEGGRDQLTRLFNRRFLRTVMQREIKSSLASGESFAVLLLDIDHFKRINDQFGHDAGDVVLQQFSEVVTLTIRAGDFVFRYGGEEFLCVITSVGPEHAKSVAEKIRKAIESHKFSIGENDTIDITTSIGLAIFDGHPDYSHLISKADLAVYQAKNEGRNRVSVFKTAQE